MLKSRHTFVFLLVFTLLLAACSKGNTDKTPPPEGEPPEVASRFVALLQAGDYDTAVSYFDSTMKNQLPAKQLQTAWESLLQQAGNFRQEVAKKSEETGGYEIIIVTAQFEQAYIDIRITFDSDNRIAGLFFAPSDYSAAEDDGRTDYTPPAYGQPADFTEEEITVGKGEWALPGTLTVPSGDGPFPAVILVHGSGPNDRDETIGPNKPFKDIAWGLANQGIAVLRYEKRTLAHRQKMASLPSLTVNEEVIDDVLAAFELLQEREIIDPEKIFVAGHSLGGTLAPRIAAANDKIAGLLILAGTARPLEDLILEQTRYLAEADGNITADEEEQIELIEQQVNNIKDPGLSAATPATELLGIPASYWLDLRAYNPVETAKKLKVPMLFLQGERDYQVTMEDFSLWQEALGGLPHATFKSYPALNHLFIAGTGMSLPAEYETPGNVSDAVINDLVDWIKGH